MQAITIIFLLSLAACSTKGGDGGAIHQSNGESAVQGKTFRLLMYARDKKDATAVETARRYTLAGIEIAFIDAHTMTWKTTDVFERRKYRFTGDTLEWEGKGNVFPCEMLSDGSLVLDVDDRFFIRLEPD